MWLEAQTVRYGTVSTSRWQSRRSTVRAGEIDLSCVGTLASDDGRSIVVQERFLSGGSQKTMRVEIPYAYIIRVTKASAEPLTSSLLGRSLD